MDDQPRRRSSIVPVDRVDDGVLRVNDGAMRKLSQANATIGTEIKDARVAADVEHNMSVRDSLKLYKKGIAFSFFYPWPW